jgi:hypothetical protein
VPFLTLRTLRVALLKSTCSQRRSTTSAALKAGRIRVSSGKHEDAGGALDKWLEEHRESPPQGN